MKNLLLALFITICGCTTFSHADVFYQKDGLYTLRYLTGSKGENLYDGAFVSTAKEVCPKGYKVTEKSFKPQSLDGLLLDDNVHYFWVIRCL